MKGLTIICRCCSVTLVLLDAFLFMEKNEKLFFVFLAAAFVLGNASKIIEYFQKKKKPDRKRECPKE